MAAPPAGGVPLGSGSRLIVRIRHACCCLRRRRHASFEASTTPSRETTSTAHDLHGLRTLLLPGPCASHAINDVETASVAGEVLPKAVPREQVLGVEDDAPRVRAELERDAEETSSLQPDGEVIADEEEGDMGKVKARELQQPHHHQLQLRWCLGAKVERLLDDISDIWLGAEVIRVHADDSYDIQYVDNGSREYAVEGCELRPRTVCLELPIEVWESIGGCLHEKQDLCAFHVLARTSAAASVRQAPQWWCTSYHQRFGRCGPRCSFERVAGAAGVAAAARAVGLCAAAALRGLTAADKESWKNRYISQERLNDPRRLTETSRALEPGDVFYGASGKKANYSSPLKGMFFDPRLGRMVREY